MTFNEKTLIVICGPTASGKTDVSIELAQRFDTHILSCDSRQFYKEIPIVTAAPDQEQLSLVPHHFIGNKSIQDFYSAGDFEIDALNLLDRLFAEKDCVVMTGGSGLYIDAVCNGFDAVPDADLKVRERLNKIYDEHGLGKLLEDLQQRDPEYYGVVDRNNPQRVIRALEVCISTGHPYSGLRKGNKKERPFRITKFCLDIPRELLYERINKRTEIMIENGMVEEARSVFKYKYLNSLQTVGFNELFDFFEKKTTMLRQWN